MSLLRVILALIVFLILAHIMLILLGYEPTTHEAIAAVYSLAELVEYPAWVLLADAGFYAVTLAAAGGYLILYILVGLLRRRMYHQP
jgi:hypothetical protein